MDFDLLTFYAILIPVFSILHAMERAFIECLPRVKLAPLANLSARVF